MGTPELDLSLILGDYEERWADLLASLMRVDHETTRTLLGLGAGDLRIDREVSKVDFVVTVDGVPACVIEAKLRDGFQIAQLGRYEAKVPSAQTRFVLAPAALMPTAARMRHEGGATKPWKKLTWERAIAAFARSDALAVTPWGDIARAWRTHAAARLPVRATVAPDDPFLIPTALKAVPLRALHAQTLRYELIRDDVPALSGNQSEVVRFRTEHDLLFDVPVPGTDGHGYGLSALLTTTTESVSLSVFLTTTRDEPIDSYTTRLEWVGHRMHAFPTTLTDARVDVTTRPAAGARFRKNTTDAAWPAGFGATDGRTRTATRRNWKHYYGARYSLTPADGGHPLTVREVSRVMPKVIDELRTVAADLGTKLAAPTGTTT